MGVCKFFLRGFGWALTPPTPPPPDYSGFLLGSTAGLLLAAVLFLVHWFNPPSSMSQRGTKRPHPDLEPQDLKSPRTEQAAELDSKILTAGKSKQHLFDMLLEELGVRKLALLYRGTRDGFKAHDFHRKCDGNGETILLAMTI